MSVEWNLESQNSTFAFPVTVLSNFYLKLQRMKVLAIFASNAKTYSKLVIYENNCSPFFSFVFSFFIFTTTNSRKWCRVGKWRYSYPNLLRARYANYPVY